MNDNSNLSVVFVNPLNGREAPEGPALRAKKEEKSLFQTPTLPFENQTNQTFKIKKPVIPQRTTLRGDENSKQTYEIEQRMRRKNPEFTNFAIKFSDSTWGHSSSNVPDHYATREEVANLLENYSYELNQITGANEIEKANQLQSLTDQLLDNICDQLRSECIERCQCIEQARESYAYIFNLYQEDSAKCREKINTLDNHNKKLEENLTKVIETTQERAQEIKLDCQRQIDEMKQNMESKKEEYDSSMKRFLEQKSQLEEHVKALHRVFMEFQSDSVYMTLEELKQKHESLERKMQNKDNEISKLKIQLQKLQRVIQDNEKEKNTLEQANADLRRDLSKAKQQTNQLKRRWDLQNMEMGNLDDQEEEEVNQLKQVNEQLAQKQPETNPLDEAVNQAKHTTKRRSKLSIDPTPFIRVNQKLTKLYDTMVDVLQRTNNIVPASNDQQLNEEIDSLILSGDNSLMIRAIERRADECIQVSERVDNIDLAASVSTGEATISRDPRFIQYIRSHNLDQSDVRSNVNVFCAIRQLFQAKYMSDKWNTRMGRPPQRFPEFVINYFCKDGESIFIALQRAARIYRLASASTNPEAKLFIKFLLESYTVDELTFFLEIRYSLIGLPFIPNDTPQLLNVPYVKCKELLEKVIGVFSPSLAPMVAETEKLVFSDYIDYASFLTILLKFYRGERRKRRNAVRLMFNSKKFAQSSSGIEFESFVSLVQGLGFQGPLDYVFDLYREATLLGNGIITLDSLLGAMDNLSMHFYTIETPLVALGQDTITEMNRKDITMHWNKFSKWFEKFRIPSSQAFEPWLRSTIIRRVRAVDASFKANKPVDVLYCEYRSLLDMYQYGLDVMVRGQSKPLSSEKTERVFLLLENLIDLLLYFILEQKETNIDMSQIH